MTILASFDMFVRIEFDSAKHSTDLLSSFRVWFRRARSLGVVIFHSNSIHFSINCF